MGCTACPAHIHHSLGSAAGREPQTQEHSCSQSWHSFREGDKDMAGMLDWRSSVGTWSVGWPAPGVSGLRSNFVHCCWLSWGQKEKSSSSVKSYHLKPLRAWLSPGSSTAALNSCQVGVLLLLSVKYVHLILYFQLSPV